MIYTIEAYNKGNFAEAQHVKIKLNAMGEDHAINKAKTMVEREVYKVVSVKE